MQQRILKLHKVAEMLITAMCGIHVPRNLVNANLTPLQCM